MEMVIDAGKSTFGNDVPMVIGPASQERVELADQNFCLVPVPFVDVSASLFQHAADTLVCRERAARQNGRPSSRA